MENGGRAPLPSGLGAPGADPGGKAAPSSPELPWLEPFPDALLRPESADTAAVAAARSGLRLALIAGLQQLPVRQRTGLILRDVPGWRPPQAAELLGVTRTAVTSALQRARGQLHQGGPAASALAPSSTPACGRPSACHPNCPPWGRPFRQASDRLLRRAMAGSRALRPDPGGHLRRRRAGRRHSATALAADPVPCLGPSHAPGAR